MAALLFRMRCYPARSLPGAMAVDSRGNLYYHPETLERFTPQQLEAVLYHEVWHLLARHHERFQNEPRLLANIATDLAINSQLREEGFSLPGNVVVPEQYGLPKLKSSEYYYERIRNRKIQVEVSLDSEGDDEGDGEQSSSSSSGQDDDIGGSARVRIRCNNIEREVDMHWDGALAGGSCADGRRRDYEVDGGLDDLARRYVEYEVAKAIQQQKTRGDVPAEWTRWAEAVLQPKLPWQHILRSAVRAEAQQLLQRLDYSWLARNRRQNLSQAVLPSLRSPIPRVGILIDTSGSMSRHELNQALTEVKRALSFLKQVTVYSADAKLQTSQSVRSHKQVKLVGGGGTSMKRAVEEIAASRNRPHLLVIITDGETDWPDPVRGMKMIAAITVRRDKRQEIPPHLRAVYIEPEEEA